MKKINLILCLAAAALMLSSCGNNLGYKKTKSGLLYKIIGNGNDTLVKEGNILKFNIQFKRERNDSVLNTTYGKLPGFVAVQKVQGDPYNITEIFPLLHAGDSAVVVQFVDSLVKKNPTQAQLPPFLNKNDKIIATVKVIKVFATEAAATADRNAEMQVEADKNEKEAAQDLVTEVKEMEAWLANKKITAQRTGTGTFVVVKDPGTGMQIDSGSYVSIRYEGKTLRDEKIFESTLDPNTQPYTFQMYGANSPIKGWLEGLKLFKQGGKGTLYIPGALAYGRNPQPGSPFKINDAMIFEINVVSVSATPPAAPQQQQLPPQIREQMEKQLKAQQEKQQQKKGN
jgi:FKBP-type peptidyl-prolyl cis-trans isomerase FkpA